MRPTQTWLDAFAVMHAEWATPRGAQGMCVNAMSRLRKVATDAGVDISTLSYVSMDVAELSTYETPVASEWTEHFALAVGPWVIDFTARQYNPRLPFPYIFHGVGQPSVRFMPVD